MNWKPMGDQILVREIKKETKTKSGIIVMSGMDEYVTCEVVATGDGLFTQTGDRIPMTTKPGMTVMIYSAHLGDQKRIKLEDTEYVLLRESEVGLINLAE